MAWTEGLCLHCYTEVEVDMLPVGDEKVIDLSPEIPVDSAGQLAKPLAFESEETPLVPHWFLPKFHSKNMNQSDDLVTWHSKCKNLLCLPVQNHLIFTSSGKRIIFHAFSRDLNGVSFEDDFSIGSNDLTQLTVGLDRDSGDLGRWEPYGWREP